MILKKSWGQGGGPGPQGPRDPLLRWVRLGCFMPPVDGGREGVDLLLLVLIVLSDVLILFAHRGFQVLTVDCRFAVDGA